MPVAVVTGSGGLVGSESVRFLAPLGFDVVGVDNDMRAYFFGENASTAWNCRELQKEFGPRYRHVAADIRDRETIERLFSEYDTDIKLIIHAAAQPSHDWAAREPLTDFTVNANGTLTLLEAARNHAPQAVFILLSTNKVYGDLPNTLPLIEEETRWEVRRDHPYFHGIDEKMSIDQSTHSLFGASKVAADVLTQEYGRYFGMKTAAFRGGCLTGPSHSGAQLHGFLAYLMRCAIRSEPYTIFGYKGKQVRDNIHSRDLVAAFYEFYKAPRAGEVYNMGGSRFSNCSMMEAVSLCEEIVGKKMVTQYRDENRVGDHIWYISDVRKFQAHYPAWKYQYGIREILMDIYEAQVARV
jgi:CDP-paratose 2-epimerase